MDTDDIIRRTAANRRRAADLLDGLAPEQWATPSLCAGWTVRDLAGHMIMPVEVSIPRFLLTLVRARGSADRAVDLVSRRLARREPAEIVATLRAKADCGIQPPGVGALGPMSDGCIHLSDATRPLGLDTPVPLDDWRIVLDFLASKRARRGFVPAGRLTGLTLRATDQEWRSGDGPEIAGPSEALAIAMAGRPAALADLDGDGVALLRTRLSAA